MLDMILVMILMFHPLDFEWLHSSGFERTMTVLKVGINKVIA
jgi:hypothetical protein